MKTLSYSTLHLSFFLFLSVFNSTPSTAAPKIQETIRPEVKRARRVDLRATSQFERIKQKYEETFLGKLPDEIETALKLFTLSEVPGIGDYFYDSLSLAEKQTIDRIGDFSLTTLFLELGLSPFLSTYEIQKQIEYQKNQNLNDRGKDAVFLASTLLIDPKRRLLFVLFTSRFSGSGSVNIYKDKNIGELTEMEILRPLGEEIKDLFETVLHSNSRSDFFEQLNLQPNLSDLEYSQIMRTLKFYLNSKDFRKEKLSRKAEDYFRLVSSVLSDKQLLVTYRRILEIRDQK